MHILTKSMKTNAEKIIMYKNINVLLFFGI